MNHSTARRFWGQVVGSVIIFVWSMGMWFVVRSDAGPSMKILAFGVSSAIAMPAIYVARRDDAVDSK